MSSIQQRGAGSADRHEEKGARPSGTGVGAGHKPESVDAGVQATAAGRPCRHRVVQTGQDIAHVLGVDGFAVATQTDNGNEDERSVLGGEGDMVHPSVAAMQDTSELLVDRMLALERRLARDENERSIAADMALGLRAGTNGSDHRTIETQTYAADNWTMYPPAALDLESAVAVQLPPRVDTSSAGDPSRPPRAPLPFSHATPSESEGQPFLSVRAIPAPRSSDLLADAALYAAQRRAGQRQNSGGTTRLNSMVS